MKNKTILQIGFYSTTIGWFPFMWIAVWASHNREYSIIAFLIGLIFCTFGCLMILPLIKNNDLLKSIDELEKERQAYINTTIRLNQKIKEL